MTTPITHPLPEGTQIRLSRELTEDEKKWAAAPRYDREFTVDEFLTAGDPAHDEVPVDFYVGNADGGSGNVCVPADAVEVVRTAAQMAARRPPTRPQLRDAVQSQLTGLSTDTFECDETDRDGDFAIEVYGRTTEGLPFGFRVRVEQVWETDL